ncbi:TrfB-related DNA-binding protein [Herbaspirillum huttiense]|uniref:KfrB domain-containing protein n=1 Tax=Herbaspirillum huttiense TaxID=863372 RepID=UPI00382686FE
MNIDEFNAVIATTRLTASNREAARAVLVDQRKRPEVENEFGLKRQRMQQILDVVNGAAEKFALQQQTQIVPANQIEVSLALAVRAARAELGENITVTEADHRVDRNFTGRVIAKADFHIAQDVGRGNVVVHSLARLAQVPAVGDAVTLEYRGGRAGIKDRAAPELGRGR